MSADSATVFMQADAGGGLYGDGGVLIASLRLRQSDNTASDAATANLGCGDCRSAANGAAASSISNAPAYSTASNTVIPGKWPFQLKLCSTAGLLAAAIKPSCGQNEVPQGHKGQMSADCRIFTAALCAVGQPSGGGGGGGGLSGGSIAGIVIGVLAGIILLAILVWFLLRRRRAKRADVEMARSKESPVSAAASRNHGAQTPSGVAMFHLHYWHVQTLRCSGAAAHCCGALCIPTHHCVNRLIGERW